MQQLPPSITGSPAFGSMPVAQATGNPGHMAAASAGIRQAMHILSAEVSKLPPGSEPQRAVMKCIESLSKAFPESEASQGVQKTQALGMAQQAQQQNPLSSLMRALSGQGGGMGAEQPQQQQAA